VTVNYAKNDSAEMTVIRFMTAFCFGPTPPDNLLMMVKIALPNGPNKNSHRLMAAKWWSKTANLR
jgi:hypothetical protein